MRKQGKKTNSLIVVLSTLLFVNFSALAGLFIYNQIKAKEVEIVALSGNIITPESADERVFADTEPSSAKVKTLTLNQKQAEIIEPFVISNMFPGDQETQYFRIRAQANEEFILRHTGLIQSKPGEDYKKLSEVLEVKVRVIGMDGVLYSGLLRDMPDVLEYTVQPEGNPGGEVIFATTISLPTNVTSEYSGKDLTLDFIWWVDETDSLKPPVNSGIFSDWKWYLAAGVLAAAALWLLGYRRSKGKEEYSNGLDPE